MIHPRSARRGVVALALLALMAGCAEGPVTGEVSGTVMIAGQVPPPGSSITFIPIDGKSPTAGAVLEEGKYSVRVATGMARVEIRAPRPQSRAARKIEGPGSEGGLIEESLPPRYNDESELTFDVKAGKNPKNWELTVP